MSWSLPTISGTAEQVKQAVADSSAPQSIKDYVGAGIDGLVKLYGADVGIKVNGSGHLCTGADYQVTSASIEVNRADPVPQQADAPADDPSQGEEKADEKGIDDGTQAQHDAT